eukprot:evm.model.NODE_12998_length_13939_cov_25.947701.3
MNNPYSDNPFDAIYAAPVPIQGSSSSHTSPSQQQQQQQQQAAALDDLINPFAVLGMENKSQKSPTAVSSPYYQASGAGYTFPYAEASSAALYSPSHGPQQQQQQQQEWGMPSARSAFQPPAPIVTFQPYSPSVSPAFGSSPSSAYGQASPTQGTYSPASPAFHSGLHTGQGSPYAAASPFSFDGGSPYGNNSSNGDNKPNVTDADLSLFAGPVEATNAAAVGPSPSSPPPQQQQQQQQEVGASPAADDGWDIDDFGISWEAPEVAVAPTADAADADAAVPVQREQLERQEEEAVPAPESPPRNVSAPRGKKVSAIEAAIMAEHKMEGNVLARISVRTLIVKEWKETYWVIHHGKVLLYRSKEDYLYNPIGVMVKKDIPLRCNLRCSEVTCKPYKGYGDLYHFTLEEIFEYGPSLVAKFASSDVKGIRELRAVIVAYIIAERKKRGGGGRRSPVGPQGRSSAFANQERGRHQLPSPVQPRQASPRRGGGSPKMASGASMASGAGGQDKYAKWGQIS